MRRFFFRSNNTYCPSKKLLSNLNCLCSLNYLNGVVAASVLAALFVAAFFAAAHCTQCNSSDKKHFLHVFKKFLKPWNFGFVELRKQAYIRLAQTFIIFGLIKLYFVIYFSQLCEKRCKITIFFAHIQKKL